MHPVNRSALLGMFNGFCDIILRQMRHGGEKYAFLKTDNKYGEPPCEWTDVLTSVNPSWLFVTCAKYVGRHKIYEAERDILKIATYIYIGYLQEGYPEGETCILWPTDIDLKEQAWNDFRGEVLAKIRQAGVNLEIGRWRYSRLDVLERHCPGYARASLLDLMFKMGKMRKESKVIDKETYLEAFIRAFQLWAMCGYDLEGEHDEDTDGSHAKREVEELAT